MNLLELFVKVAVDDQGVDPSLRALEKKAAKTEKAAQINLDAKVSGEKTASLALSNLDRKAKAVDGQDVDINVDKDGSASGALSSLSGGFKGLASNIRATGTIVAAAAIPAGIAAIGAATPALLATAASAGGLALNLGKAAAGFGLVGGVAAGGARVGLEIYGRVLSSVVTSSVEAFAATHEQVVEQAELQRQTTLNTKASEAFNLKLLDMRQGFAELQAAIGNRVFPMFTKEMTAWQGVLAKNKGEIVDTAAGVANMAVSFSEWFRTAKDGKIFADTLHFIDSSAIKAAAALNNMGQAAISFIQPLLPMASKLQDRILALTIATNNWVQSSAGQSKLTKIFKDLWEQSKKLWPVIKNLAKGIFNLFSAIDKAGLADQATRGLAAIASGFEHITREGTKSRGALDKFLKGAKDLMPFVGRLVLEFAKQVGRIASELIGAKKQGDKLTTLQKVFKAVTSSFKPLADMIISTFKGLGPQLAKLIPQLAKFFKVFMGTTGPLNAFVGMITSVLKIFNKLPGPVKTFIANMVALKVILGAMGIGTVASAFGGLAKNQLLASQTAKKSAAAFGVEKAASTGLSASIRGIGASFKAAAVSAAAFLTVSTGGTFLAIVAALAAVAAVAIVVAKNWGRIKQAIKPVTEAFKTFWNLVKPALAQLGGAFVAALKKFASGLLSAIVPGKKFGQQIHEIADRIGDFVLHRIPPAIKALKLLAAGVQHLGPVFKVVGKLIGFFLITPFKVLWAVLKAGYATVKFVIRLFTDLGKNLKTQGPVTKFVIKVWKDLWNFIKKAAQGIWNAVKDAWASIKKNTSDVWNAIKKTTQDVWNAIKKFLSSIWDAIKKAISDRIEAIKNLLHKAWDVIKSVASSAWDNIKKAISGRVDAMKKAVSKTIDNLKSALHNAWDVIKKVASKAWDAIKDAIWKPVKTAYNNVKSWINKIIDVINKVLKLVGLPELGKSDSGGGSGSGSGSGSSAGGSGPSAGGTRPHQGSAPNPIGLAKGGVVAPGERVIVGDAPREYVINPTRKDNEQYLRGAAAEMGYSLSKRPHRRDSRVPPGGAWGEGYSVSPITTHHWAPEITGRVHSIARATHTVPNTYPGHGEPGGSTEEYTADFWGPGGRGSPISKAMGFKTADLALSKYNHDPGVLYLIRQGEYWRGGHWQSNTYGDPHYDHTHVSWDSPGGDAASGSGASVNPMAAIFEAAWARLVQPIADRFIDPLMDDPFRVKNAVGAGAGMMVSAIHDWIADKVGSSGAGGGSVGSSPKGLTADDVVRMGGWPSSKHKTAVGIMWEESGFIANNGNGTYEGLFAMGKPAMEEVGMSFSRVHEPVYNSTAANKLQAKLGWQPWTTYPPSADSMSRGGQKITGYNAGGLIKRDHIAMMHANELALPLNHPAVSRQVQVAMGTGELRAEIREMREVLAKGLKNIDFNDKGAATILQGGHNAFHGALDSSSGKRHLKDTITSRSFSGFSGTGKAL